MFPKAFSILSNRTFSTGFFRKFPQYKERREKSGKHLTKVIKEFHNDFIDAVIENRQGAELPLLMGKFVILAYKSKPYINFTKYNPKGEISKFINTHTDGLTCNLYYEKDERRYRFKDKNMWAFATERPFRRKISKAFSKNHVRYIVSPDKKKAFFDALDFKLKDITDRKVEEYLKTYDELFIE